MAAAAGLAVLLAGAAATLVKAAGGPIAAPGTRVGAAAYGDWREDAPGVRRLITASDMPAPFATRSAGNGPSLVDRPAGAMPKVPAGFHVSLFASGLENPRRLTVAPNGDIFVAESRAGRIRVLRAPDGAATGEDAGVFAGGLTLPFGIAFYPPGPDPQFVYVANHDAILRFPYRNGDTRARGPAATIVPGLPSVGGHWTRDVAFAADGQRMFVSVGSGSNVAEGQPRLTDEALRQFEASHAMGADWGGEERRADILVFAPDGSGGRVFATGIRNCAGMAVRPGSGDLWCATNERDDLGDNLPPDYVTHVPPGSFFGWPWYYIGAHEDPRHKGERRDLGDKVTTPDVLLQPHSAPLTLTFYEGADFPVAYRGDAFVALHGSWNRARRTGYKVVRIPFADGAATGAYEDFATGFVLSDGDVWGRPVGVAVAHDGALLVGEDANGTVWRITHRS